ncbi:hypothetical protein GMO_09960 [Gluconobacter morbifer G707]|uniref:Uncharacterized protein n=1 Tax=Gluconobacter morbifer G707 TaxID=1088869 RepID=G6XHN0_9PROT|nr:hypothetical protein GMO_09960 [Gluconobacter morbifer G707]
MKLKFVTYSVRMRRSNGLNATVLPRWSGVSFSPFGGGSGARRGIFRAPAREVQTYFSGLP